jgi:hypothetical protein
MSNAATGWRELAPDEVAAVPATRIGGAMLLLLSAALVGLTPLIVLAVWGARDPNGTLWVALMMGGQAFGGDRKSAYIASSMVQMLALLVWAATFAVVTLLRVRQGPIIASLLFTVAALAGPAGQSAVAIKFMGLADGLASLAAQLPHLMLNVVAAIAFWAYMHDGRRPNLYFRRRVRAAP